ncbi:hypothetical protein ACFPOB_20540 [Bosea eneae]|uniref:Uncharacterized protein n=1 Tax=Bosea eneae TaxID=151454 RepID=A0ABW0IXC0_9HYPH
MTRIDSFSREINLMVSEALSPAARSALVADAAREALAEAQAVNRAALGRDTPHEAYVDGRRGAPFEGVNPDRGVIAIEFDISIDVFDFIGRLLVLHSPVLTGAYQDSHQLYADGVAVERYDPAARAEEWVFLNVQPYARKIERGLSSQAPDGVYQSVAELARRRYGNIAAVKFTYRSPTLEYVAGEHGKGARKRMQREPARRSAMAMERATRVPAISLRLL